MIPLYIDIETIPSQDPAVKQHIAENVKVPGNIKKQESIDKWLKENGPAEAENQWLKTALDGTYGEIICIGFAVDGGTVETLSRDIEQSEADLLRRFFDRTTTLMPQPRGQIVWIGHNVPFDLRFIYHRAVLLGVKPPFRIPFNDAVYKGTMFDTMTEWAGFRGTVKLDVLAERMGIQTKDGMDGSKVWGAVKEGRIKEVAEYCAADVERARGIHHRMTFKAVPESDAA